MKRALTYRKALQESKIVREEFSDWLDHLSTAHQEKHGCPYAIESLLRRYITSSEVPRLVTIDNLTIK